MSQEPDLRADLEAARARIVELEARLRAPASERELREAQELAAVARVAQGVSHDANNVATALAGHLELLEAELPEGVPGREHLTTLRALVDRARELNQRVFGMVSRSRTGVDVVDVAAHLRGAEGFLGRLTGEEHTLVMVLRADRAMTRIDPAVFDLAICNLVLNAREAMTVAGQVTVVMDTVEIQSGLIAVQPHLSAGRYVSVRIADTGQGMDEETRARVFEANFTTKTSHAGLGLHTVQRAVHELGGAVEVASKVGLGSTVEVLLPLVESPAAGARAGAARAPGGGAETVLVAEDEAQVRRFIKHVLARAGYQVVLAEDGDAAYEAFVAQPDGVDLVLSDVVMPRLSGPKLAKKIWGRAPRQRVLLMSGYPKSVLEQRDRELDALQILYKPFTSADLLRQVRAALERDPPEAPDASDPADLREPTEP